MTVVLRKPDETFVTRVTHRPADHSHSMVPGGFEVMS